jgi:molybdate transport system substrate-binding protein
VHASAPTARRLRRVAPVPIVIAATLLFACGSDGGASPLATSSVGATSSQELTVFAAASLTESFDEIGAAFESANPGTTVTFNYGGSEALATAIEEQGGADVFASASPKWMDEVADNGPGVTDRSDFAKNRLIVIVPADNPAGIASIEDLGNPGVKLVLAAPEVPVGTYARQALDNAGVLEAAEANVVSNAEDVKAVVQTVVAGEADAGIVYVTDVTEDVSANVQAIEIPDDINVIATYPIAVVADGANADGAAAFVTYVLGPGQTTLQEFGFMPAT